MERVAAGVAAGFLGLMIIACGGTGTPDDTEKPGSICSNVGDTAKSPKGKTLRCSRKEGDAFPRWRAI